MGIIFEQFFHIIIASLPKYSHYPKKSIVNNDISSTVTQVVTFFYWVKKSTQKIQGQKIDPNPGRGVRNFANDTLSLGTG